MQKIFFIKNNDLAEINNMLLNDWSVKLIKTCEQNVALTGSSYHEETTSCFAYIVLERNENHG